MIYENENNSDFLDKLKSKIGAAKEVRQEAGVGVLGGFLNKNIRNDIKEAKKGAVTLFKDRDRRTEREEAIYQSSIAGKPNTTVNQLIETDIEEEEYDETEDNEVQTGTPDNEKKLFGMTGAGGFVWGFIATFILIAVIVGAIVYFKKG